MILVCGTGRCGSSETARILHEELGVDMGRVHHIGDEFNPKGYFEDREFQSLHLSFHLMHLDSKEGEDYPHRYKLWKEQFDKLIATKKEPWGLKDPGIADMPLLLDEYMSLNPKIIVCTRDREEAIDSFTKFKNITRKEAEKLVDKRQRHLYKTLSDKVFTTVQCNQPYENKVKQLTKWYDIFGDSL